MSCTAKCGFAGTLNQEITLISLSQSVVAGVAQQNETVQDTTWANMKGIGGTQLGLTMEADWRFELRYRTDVLARWLIGVGTRRFEMVRPPQDIDGYRESIVIYAKEILA